MPITFLTESAPGTSHGQIVHPASRIALLAKVVDDATSGATAAQLLAPLTATTGKLVNAKGSTRGRFFARWTAATTAASATTGIRVYGVWATKPTTENRPAIEGNPALDGRTVRVRRLDNDDPVGANLALAGEATPSNALSSSTGLGVDNEWIYEGTPSASIDFQGAPYILVLVDDAAAATATDGACSVWAEMT